MAEQAPLLRFRVSPSLGVHVPTIHGLVIWDQVARLPHLDLNFSLPFAFAPVNDRRQKTPKLADADAIFAVATNRNIPVCAYADMDEDEDGGRL